MHIASPAARLLACSALAPAFMTPAPAQAAEAADSAAAAPRIVVSGERAEDAPRSATGLPLEVVDTPQSVSIVGEDLIEDFGFDEINDALAVVPGIQVEQVETDRTYYTARGFDISWLMVDGLATPNVYGPTSGSLDTAFYSRIEVVRGANALLSGIGNPAGTINFVRRRPSGETGGSAAISFGSWNTARAEADLDLALTEDAGWGLRATGAVTTGDSHLRDYASARYAGQVILTGAITPDLSLALGYSHQQNDADNVLWGALPLINTDGTPTDFPAGTSTTQDWTFWDTTNSRAFAELAWELVPDWTLRSVLTRQNIRSLSEIFYVYGTPDPATGLGLFGYPGAYDFDTGGWISDIELTGTFSAFGREHDLTVGVQYSDTGFHYLGRSVPFSDPAWGALPALPDWTGQEVPRPAYDAPAEQADFDYRMWRAYGATRLALTDRLSLIAGANYIDVKSDGFSFGADFGRNEKALSPFAGLTFEAFDGIRLYASYSDIFLPQHEIGTDFAPLGAAKGESMEVGLKAQTEDGALLGTLALFRAEQSNLAESAGFDPASGLTLFTGIEVVSKGVEAEITGRIAEGLLVQAGITHLSLDDGKGNAVRSYVPRTTADIALRWQPTERLSLGAVLGWQDDIHLDSTFGRIEQDAYATLQLQAGYQLTDRLELQANVANATDTKHVASLYWEQAYYAPPRNYTLTLRGRF
ncbi:MAG: TonB-dependent siderophore receptor [Erythrobacter sp.]